MKRRDSYNFRRELRLKFVWHPILQIRLLWHWTRLISCTFIIIFFIASDLGPCCRWDGFWSSASLWRVQRAVCVQEQCVLLHRVYHRLDQMCFQDTNTQQERMENPKGRLWVLLTPLLLSRCIREKTHSFLETPLFCPVFFFLPFLALKSFCQNSGTLTLSQPFLLF